jgi:K+-transporting ATPase ATPase B chain
VLSDWIIVRITANPGESFIDRMISMVEGAKRQKTERTRADDPAGGSHAGAAAGHGHAAAVFALRGAGGQGRRAGLGDGAVALLVCLIPTTIGGLLSAIGVAGMSRMMQANVIATSGRAVEAAGDVDVLLLDKTGTITWQPPGVAFSARPA